MHIVVVAKGNSLPTLRDSVAAVVVWEGERACSVSAGPERTEIAIAEGLWAAQSMTFAAAGTVVAYSVAVPQPAPVLEPKNEHISVKTKIHTKYHTLQSPYYLLVGFARMLLWTL